MHSCLAAAQHIYLCAAHSIYVILVLGALTNAPKDVPCILPLHCNVSPLAWRCLHCVCTIICWVVRSFALFNRLISALPMVFLSRIAVHVVVAVIVVVTPVVRRVIIIIVAIKFVCCGGSVAELPGCQWLPACWSSLHDNTASFH